jgi:hypothetical protein
VTREALRKELAWRPLEPWADATAAWKDADTIVVEYTRADGAEPRRIERRIDAAGWTRVASP